MAMPSPAVVSNGISFFQSPTAAVAFKSIPRCTASASSAFPFDSPGDSIGKDLVANRLFGYLQRVNQRHPGMHQRTKHPAKTHQSESANRFSNKRRAQQDLFQRTAPVFGCRDPVNGKTN